MLIATVYRNSLSEGRVGLDVSRVYFSAIRRVRVTVTSTGFLLLDSDLLSDPCCCDVDTWRRMVR